MFKISRILAPVVFSDHCRSALRHTASIGSWFGSEITVLHVIQPLSELDFDTTSGLEYLEKCRLEWVSREFEKLKFELRDHVPLSTVCAEGDPTTEILRAAEAMDASLIMMASHGHGRFRRLLLGSVTAKVLHDARCPVWTGVHLESADALRPPTHDIRSVVCLVNFSCHSDEAMAWAAGFASAYDAHLSLVHLLPPAHNADRSRDLRDEARWQLDSRSPTLNAETECHVVVGDVTRDAGETIRRLKGELVVIGRGHKEGGRLRSTAYAIIRESPCPVVSV